MSDQDLPDLPELPSDEELGITEEDIRAAEDEGRVEGASRPASAPPAGAGSAGEGGKGGGTAAPPLPTETQPAPAGGARGPLTLLVLLALTLVSTQWWALPAPAPANAPDTAFSSARAMSHLVEIAARAHPPGSPEHDRVRRYILDELTDLGLEPTVQTTTSMIRGREAVRAATVRNIVARIPGTEPTGALLLTAHYDGRGIATAAADDGMGVVAILEATRALLAGAPPRNDVVLLVTDAEELGLLGARAFVAEHPLMEDVTVALSVEMRGGGGASIMFETGAQNGWIVRRYAESARAPFTSSMSSEVYRRMPNDTDFTPLREAGVQGLNFAGIGRAHVYHQTYDTPENASEATLQHHGLQLLSMTRALGAADLGSVDAPSVTYFTVPFLGVVTYGQTVTWAVAAGLLLLFVLVLVLTRRRGAGWGGMVVGLAMTLLASVAAWGLGTWLVAWLPRFHPEQGALHGSLFHSEGWYVLALAAAAFVLTAVLLGLARRRFSLGALALGAAVVPVAGALAATFVAPMAAMHLQWPALAALVAAAAASGVGPRSRPGWGSWVLSLLMAAPVLFLLVFLTESGWLALTFAAAPILGVLLAVILGLLLPAMDALREPNPWWAPTLGLLAAAAFLGVGILMGEPTADRPLPTTLAYALDRETGRASWVTQPLVDEDGDSPDPARAWAVERAGAAFDATLPLPWFLQAAPPYPAADAPVVEAAQPQLAVVADTVSDGARTVRLALRSGMGAEMMMVELPDGAELTRVNGHPLPREAAGGGAVQRPVRVTHWGRPEDALLLDLTVPAGASTLSLAVVEHLLRPEEILGEAPWRRPPEMAPNVVRNSDRAMIRTPLSLVLTGASPEAPGPGEGGTEPDDATEPVGRPAADTAGVTPPDTTGAPGITGAGPAGP